MNKVKITIDEYGWKIKLKLNGKTYTERMERTGLGVTGESVFEMIDEIPDNLLEGLESIYPFETMKALEQISFEEWDDY